MICVYFLLPSRVGAIIASGEHSFPSEPRRARRLFRRPARQATIRCPNQSRFRTLRLSPHEAFQQDKRALDRGNPLRCRLPPASALGLVYRLRHERALSGGSGGGRNFYALKRGGGSSITSGGRSGRGIGIGRGGLVRRRWRWGGVPEGSTNTLAGTPRRFTARPHWNAA